MAEAPPQCPPGDAAFPGGPGDDVHAPRFSQPPPSQPTFTPFAKAAGKG